jgi:diguanylate cyclase (GGDEF)-like protein
MAAFHNRKNKQTKYILGFLSLIAYCIGANLSNGDFKNMPANLSSAIAAYAFLFGDPFSPFIIAAILAFIVSGKISFHITGAEFQNILFGVAASAGAASGIIGYLVGKYANQRDELKDKNEALNFSALHDSLTGLPNRVFLDRQLKSVIDKKNIDKDYNFAVAFMDLDRFKIINDSLGHSNGDKLLVEISNRLITTVQDNGFVARLGGDEFAIILENYEDVNDVKFILEKILSNIKKPAEINAYKIVTSASIGVVFGTKYHCQTEEYLRYADIAMYRAKASGKDKFEFFDTSIEKDILRNLRLENDLKYALERNELVLFYQPVVCLKTGKITGFEALIRWMHPEFGLVPPMDFIPIAEETGLIIPIGKWILYEACKQNSQWQKMSTEGESLIMNVNISPMQLTQWDIVEEIKSALEETNLPASSLNIEITESALIKNIKISQLVLQQIRDLGVSIHIDDFGTGFSSLNYLQQFPFDVVKVDRSFIQQISLNHKSKGVLRSIVMMAHELNMTVVGEGIETSGQMAELKEMGVEHGQGYYFAKPMNSKAIEEMLYKNSQEIIEQDA